MRSWPDGEHYSCPLQFLVVFLLPFVFTRLFSDWRCIVLSKFFDTQVSSISTEELVLPCHAHYALSHLRCNGHSLLSSSYLTRIGRMKNPSCSACGHLSQDTSHLILRCPTTNSLRRSLFGTLWSRFWRVARLLGSMVFCHAPIPQKRPGNSSSFHIAR